jgi:hypothetical protein
MTNQEKKCPHCGSTATLPIVYGLMSDEVHQENAIKREWVWGGCKLNSQGTDYCNDCGENFGDVVSYDRGQKKFTIQELQAKISKNESRIIKEKIKKNMKNRFLKFKSFIGVSSGKQ